MPGKEQSPPPRSASAFHDLRQRAEALLSKPGSEVPSIPGEGIKELVHELQVHQMELEIQNEELREAQLELRESHDRYSDLYEFAPVGYLTLDSEGAILESNLTAASMLGNNRANLIGSKLSDFVVRDHQDALYLHRRKVLSTTSIQTCELEMRRSDAIIRDMQLESIGFRNKSIGVDHYCRTALIDITEEKQAREWKDLALQVLQMVEHLPVGAIYVDHETIQMNHAAEEITGYTRAELNTLDQWFRALYGPRHGERRQEYQVQYDAGLPIRETTRIIRKDGKERIIEFAGHRFDDHAVWILQDVTEREKGSEALRESEARVHAILASLSAHIAVLDSSGTIVAVNPAWEKFARENGGVSCRCSTGTNYLEICRSAHGISSEEAPEVVAALEAILKGEREEFSMEYPCHSDTRKRWFFLQATSLKSAEGGAVVSHMDTTERRLAEEALKLEHEFSENLIETTQSIILVLDPDGRIIRFNSVFERLTGWTLEEAEGRDWFGTFLPEPDRNQVRELFQRAMGGQSTNGNVNTILTKAGKERQIEWYDSVLRESDGNLIGLICSGIDVTESRYLEREVYRASEMEKVRIAGDLHDNLGSMLTGISLLASALKRKLKRGEPVNADDADGILESIREAINQTRALARGLHGIGDDPYVLADALEALGRRVQVTSGLRCRFVNRGDGISLHNPATANHLLRIAQEALTNAVRHSGATHFTIRLGKLDDGRNLLIIKDNGCGFDPMDLGQTESLGLRTMEYRARSIGAFLSIKPRKKKGTAVSCIFVDA